MPRDTGWRYPTHLHSVEKVGESPRLVILSRKALGQSCTEIKFLRNRSNDLSRKPVVFVALLSFFAVLGLSVSAGAADKQTLTGEVSDAMCGTAHMQGTPAECTRVCTGRGAK